MTEKNKSKRELNKHNKIKNLLASASELFITKGFDKTSIDEITKKSKVAKGTFYLYFTDKIDIRNKIIIEKSSELFDLAYKEVDKKSIATREDKLIAFFDYIINYLADDKDLLSLIHKNISVSFYRRVIKEDSKNNAIVRVLDNFREEFADVFTGEEFLINLFIIVEMVGSVIYSSIIHGEPAEIDLIKPYLYKNIRKIVGK